MKNVLERLLNPASARLVVDGFKLVFDAPALSLCTADEVELLLCGSREIGDFSELQRVTIYRNGFNSSSPTTLD